MTMRRAFFLGSLMMLAMQGTLPATAARGGETTDLREIRVGMAVKDLPTAGYTNFSCAAEPSVSLAGWQSWNDCRAGQDGLHAVRFGYDPQVSHEGTMVAGHPAVLTLLVDDHASVAGLLIETDPKARLYMRKKAFLLGMQAKSHYGDDGWSCTDAPRAADQEPLGGTYVNTRCEKTTDGRAVTIEQRLFHRVDQDPKTFVDETRISIMRAGN
jgi:hypothetical protein